MRKPAGSIQKLCQRPAIAKVKRYNEILHHEKLHTTTHGNTQEVQRL